MLNHQMSVESPFVLYLLAPFSSFTSSLFSLSPRRLSYLTQDSTFFSSYLEVIDQLFVIKSYLITNKAAATQSSTNGECCYSFDLHHSLFNHCIQFVYIPYNIHSFYVK